MDKTPLDQLIESEIDDLIQDDDYYQSLATPLKSAAIIKQDHRRQLTEFFHLKEQSARMELAEKLITDLIPAKLREELDNSTTYFSRFMETHEEEDRPFLFQEMLGISDATLLHIDALGQDLVQKGQFSDALAIFTFLTILAPHVTSYWILEGICYQHLDQYREALAAYSAAKFLNPSDPLPITHSIECYRALKENELLKQETQLLNQLK